MPRDHDRENRLMSLPRPRASALVASSAVLGLAVQAWAAAVSTPMAVDMSNRPDGSQVMRLDRSKVPAGKVSFKVKNSSTDMVHEFLVVPTQLTPEQFPMNKDGSRVDEKKLKGIKELGDLELGKSGTLAMTLRPGHYVLFCNEPGHFKGGMYAELAVAK